MAGLDIGAKDGKDRPVGNVLEFNRILDVVEEENRVPKVSSRCKGEGDGVRQGGKAIPLLRGPTVGGQEIGELDVSLGAQVLAQRFEVERRGRRFSQEDEKLPEVFLEEVLGEGKRVGQDLAERVIEREGARGRGGLRQRLQFQFELQEKRGFPDVRGAVDEHRGADARLAFAAHSQQRGKFLPPAEELPRPKRKFRAMAPQEAHYANPWNKVIIRINVT